MTPLQSIMATVRNANILLPAQVNYGITDNLQPPYISIDGFEYTHEYQTCTTPALRKSLFHVICVDKTADSVQEIGERVISLLDESTSVTPETSRCLLQRYKIGQSIIGDKALYQWVVDIAFELNESL